MNYSPYDPLPIDDNQSKKRWGAAMLVATAINSICVLGTIACDLQAQTSVAASLILLVWSLVPLVLNQHFIIRYPSLVSGILLSLGAVLHLGCLYHAYYSAHLTQTGVPLTGILFKQVFYSFVGMSILWTIAGLLDAGYTWRHG